MAVSGWVSRVVGQVVAVAAAADVLGNPNSLADVGS